MTRRVADESASRDARRDGRTPFATLVRSRHHARAHRQLPDRRGGGVGRHGGRLPRRPGPARPHGRDQGAQVLGRRRTSNVVTRFEREARASRISSTRTSSTSTTSIASAARCSSSWSTCRASTCTTCSSSAAACPTTSPRSSRCRSRARSTTCTTAASSTATSSRRTS